MSAPWTLTDLIIVDFALICIVVAMLWVINHLPRMRQTREQAAHELVEHFADYIRAHHGPRCAVDDENCFTCQLWHAHDELQSTIE